MRAVILYHVNCADGTAGAAVAIKHFKQIEDSGYDAEIETIAVQYKLPTDKWWDLLRQIGEPDFLYIVDFSFPLDRMRTLAKVTNFNFYWFDHHASSAVDFDGIVGTLSNEYPVRINAKHLSDMSGAKLTWHSLFGRFANKPDAPCPEWLEYVSDRDLWKFELRNSKVFHQAFIRYFNKPELFAAMISPDCHLENSVLDAMVLSGAALLEAHEALVASYAKSGKWINVINTCFQTNSSLHPGVIETVITPAKIVLIMVPSNYTADVAEKILSDNPDVDIVVNAILCKETETGEDVILSCRSKPRSRVTARTFVENYSGAGHDNAASAKVTLETFLDLYKHK